MCYDVNYAVFLKSHNLKNNNNCILNQRRYLIVSKGDHLIMGFVIWYNAILWRNLFCSNSQALVSPQVHGVSMIQEQVWPSQLSAAAQLQPPVESPAGREDW